MVFCAVHSYNVCIVWQVNWEFWTNSNDMCGAVCNVQREFIKVCLGAAVTTRVLLLALEMYMALAGSGS